MDSFYIDGQDYTYIDLIEDRPVLIRNYYGLKIALLRYIFNALCTDMNVANEDSDSYMKVAHEDSDSYYDLRMQAAQRAFSDKLGIGDANGMNSETWAYLKKVIEDYGVNPSTFDRGDFYSRFDYQVKKLYLESIDLYNSNCNVASLVSTMQLMPTINEYSSSADINSLQMLLRGFGLFINFESYSDVQTLCAVQALEEKMGTSSDDEFDYQDWNTLLDFFESHYENLTSDEKNSICNDLYNRQQELMQQYIEDRLVVTPTAEVGADGAVTITADNSYADFIDIKVYSGSDIVWGASTDSVATVASEVYKVNTTENTQSTVLNVVYNLDSSGQTPLKALKEIYSVRLYNTSESQTSVSSAVYGQNGVVGSLASYRSIDLTLDPGTYIICVTATKTINGSRWSSSESASLYYSKENWSSEFTIQGTSEPTPIDPNIQSIKVTKCYDELIFTLVTLKNGKQTVSLRNKEGVEIAFDAVELKNAVDSVLNGPHDTHWAYMDAAMYAMNKSIDAGLVPGVSKGSYEAYSYAYAQAESDYQFELSVMEKASIIEVILTFGSIWAYETSLINSARYRAVNPGNIVEINELEIKSVAEGISKIESGLSDISFTDKIEKTAEELNAFWKSNGYVNPPYKLDIPAYQLKLTEETSFVKVYDGVNSNEYGQFVMKLEDITNANGSFLTAQQIKDKYALEFLPKYVADAKIPVGTTMNCGIAGPIEGWGSGGGLQFDLNWQKIGNFTYRATLEN